MLKVWRQSSNDNEDVKSHLLRLQKNFIFGIMMVRELNIICLYHFINKCNYHEVRNEECEEIEGKSVNEHLAQ